MYLSRVEIDDANRQKIKDLSHLGAYHNWVETSFPAEINAQQHSRKLWRIDQLHGKRYLLLLSESSPDLKLLEKYGVPGSAQTKKYDELLEKIKNGAIVRFKATLNPVMSISSGKDSGKRGRVVPHVTVEQQLKFIKDKASKNGFALIDGEFSITERGFEILRKAHAKPVHLSKASYEGVLHITDISKFKEALTNGIGRKKAYGCGLLTIIVSD